MPMRPPRLCPCGRTVPGGQRCPSCEAIRKREVEARRKPAAHRGYGRDWQRATKAFLAKPENQICVCGCGGKATTVDHRKPHKGDARLFWDRSNWQPMTWPCHSRKTAAMDGGFGNPVVEGMPGSKPPKDAAAARDGHRVVNSNSAPSLGIRR